MDRYHPKCAKQLFDQPEVPVLEVGLDQLHQLARVAVQKSITIPGVQSKLSLEIARNLQGAAKLTIVGLWGRYILKPPSEIWPELPANEHCTMLMAQSAGLETVPFGLIHLATGELAYITRRIDRDRKGQKSAMEDMCQLSGRLTEDKYKGSHELIAKIIKHYSANPVFDLTRFYDLVLFAYLTGNGDMHLKNFSLIKDRNLGWKLAPCYDLLSTRLIIPETEDPDELALTLNGKKSNFKIESFHQFGIGMGLNKKQIENSTNRLLVNKSTFLSIIEHSFLTEERKEGYRQLMLARFGLFG